MISNSINNIKKINKSKNLNKIQHNNKKKFIDEEKYNKIDLEELSKYTDDDLACVLFTRFKKSNNFLLKEALIIHRTINDPTNYYNKNNNFIDKFKTYNKTFYSKNNIVKSEDNIVKSEDNIVKSEDNIVKSEDNVIDSDKKNEINHRSKEKYGNKLLKNNKTYDKSIIKKNKLKYNKNKLQKSL